jgi:hypothetical protein
MPRLALNRKDMARVRDGESIGRKAPVAADFTNQAWKRFQCGGIVAGSAGAGSHNRGHIAS